MDNRSRYLPDVDGGVWLNAWRAEADNVAKAQQRETRNHEMAGALAEIKGISVVYFLRAGQHIKIGTTQDIAKRRRELNCGYADILAIVPGGRTEERKMHERFASALAKGNEWFHPTPELLGFINDIRERCGVPSI